VRNVQGNAINDGAAGQMRITTFDTVCNVLKLNGSLAFWGGFRIHFD